jgi:DUF4097 and DUF4098 domain-containing protein YvlB
MKIIFLFLSAIVWTWGVDAAPERAEFDARGTKEIELKNAAGNVSISVSSGEKIVVMVDKKDFTEENCELQMEHSRDEFEIEVKKRRWRGECRADFDIQVPARMKLDFELASGDLLIRGIEGELDLRLGSGNVDAEGLFFKVDAKAGSGSIRVLGLIGKGEFKTGSGDVDVQFDPRIDRHLRSDLEVQTGSGNVTVSLPEDFGVKSSIRTGSGRITQEVTDRPGANYQINLRAGSGSIHLKAL